MGSWRSRSASWVLIGDGCGVRLAVLRLCLVIQVIETRKFALTPGLTPKELVQEAEMLKRVDHEYIIKLEDIFQVCVLGPGRLQEAASWSPVVAISRLKVDRYRCPVIMEGVPVWVVGGGVGTPAVWFVVVSTPPPLTCPQSPLSVDDLVLPIASFAHCCVRSLPSSPTRRCIS